MAETKKMKIGLSNSDKNQMKNEIEGRLNESFDLKSKEIDVKLKNQDDTIKGLGKLHPSGTATESEIMAFTSDKGIYIGTDTGNWYYWSANDNIYVSGGAFINIINRENIINALAISGETIPTFYNGVKVASDGNDYELQVKENGFNLYNHGESETPYELTLPFKSGTIATTGFVKGNPIDGATEDLRKIMIGSKVYNIPSGGTSGGSGSITYEEIVSTISFTIDGTTYQADEGMTWEQWVNSGYNTGSFTIRDNNVWRESYRIADKPGYFVEITATIRNGDSYILYQSGGAGN